MMTQQNKLLAKIQEALFRANRAELKLRYCAPEDKADAQACVLRAWAELDELKTVLSRAMGKDPVKTTPQDAPSASQGDG